VFRRPMNPSGLPESAFLLSGMATKICNTSYLVKRKGRTIVCHTTRQKRNNEGSWTDIEIYLILSRSIDMWKKRKKINSCISMDLLNIKC
jgi:ribosomal protein L36